MPPKIQDIARLAGVNSSTVSRVLSGKGKSARIGDDTSRRIIDIAGELGYRPNLAARALRTNKTDTLGLLVTDLSNPFFATIAAACEAEASSLGYGVVVATSGENRDRESEYLALLRSRPVDGLIMTPADVHPHDSLSLLVEKDFPLVFMDRRVNGILCDSVVVDNRSGARELISALVGIGKSNIAVAGGPRDTWTGSERMEGFREGILNSGVTLNEALVETGPYDIETGRRAAEKFMRSKDVPDAIVAANNNILIGVLEVLMEIGGPAVHIAVAAFDGVPFADLLGRPIIIADQPRREIGRVATRMLIERIEGSWGGEYREIVLPVQIKRYGINHAPAGLGFK